MDLHGLYGLSGRPVYLLEQLFALSCGLFFCVRAPCPWSRRTWIFTASTACQVGLCRLMCSFGSLPLICKAVLAAAGLLFALHALSCDLFFCVHLSWSLESPDVDVHGLYGLSGAALARSCSC